MVDSPKSEASHESSPATGKVHAVKDKQCPYCHQQFTSSSLGRHLDQFIFRKKPDGLHNVEEIRKLRGGITRRTAKGNANAKQDREASNPTTQTTSPVNHGSPLGENRVDINAPPAGGYRFQLNSYNWHSTGVINGLPGSTTASPALDTNPPTNGKRSYSSIETAAAKDILGLRGDLGSEKDTARALELALREVLDTIQAAKTKTATPSSPFPIDIQSHNFPSLVLHLLPAPATLLTSPTPFSTPFSFPLASPPDRNHLHLLQTQIASLTGTWKSNLLHSSYPPTHPDYNSYAAQLTTTAESHNTTALRHLGLAYNHYASLPRPQQQEIWQVELARAFASEKQKRKDVEERLEAVMVEAKQLSNQVETLSRCQWPREMALWPPDRKPIGGSIITEMERGANNKRRKMMTTGGEAGGIGEASTNGTYGSSDWRDEDEDEDDKHWDYDTLVGKWKKIVREDAVRKRGLTLPVPNPPLQPSAPIMRNDISAYSSSSPAVSAAAAANNNNPTTKPTAPPTLLAPSKPKPPPTTTTGMEDPKTPLLASTPGSASASSTTRFEPWSKRPAFMNEECMIGIPVSASGGGEQGGQGQGHQQNHSPRTQSHLRNDVVMDGDGERERERGGEGGGGARYGNGHNGHNGHGNGSQGLGGGGGGGGAAGVGAVLGRHDVVMT